MVATNGRQVVGRSCERVERGRGVRFEVSRRGEIVPAFVVRFEGSVHAYLNRCAHRFLELDCNAGDFFDAFAVHLLCATHGARYASTSGVCVGGGDSFPRRSSFERSTPGRHRRKSCRLGRWRPCAGAGLVKLEVIEENGDVRLDSRDDVHLVPAGGMT